MARVETTHLVDDLDGGEAAETVEFTWQGTPREIDLSVANADAFRKAVEPFVAASRRASTRTTPSSRPATSAVDREFNQQVRTWARKRGMKVADRGRLPADVLDAHREQSGGPRAVAS